MGPELPTSRDRSRTIRRFLPLVFCVVSAACSWQDSPTPRTGAAGASGIPVPADPTSTDPVSTSPEFAHRRAAAAALAQVGAPYRYGGAAPGGFDCSGLVQFAYAQTGVTLPRTTLSQWRELPRVPTRERRIGDLLFFRIDGRLAHVGMYVGDGRFVHAPRTGSRVRVEQVNAPFYARRLAGVARPLP